MFPDSQKTKTHSNSNSNGYDVVAFLDVAVVDVDAGVVEAVDVIDVVVDIDAGVVVAVGIIDIVYVDAGVLLWQLVLLMFLLLLMLMLVFL